MSANSLLKITLASFYLLWDVLSSCSFANVFSLCSMIWSTFYMIFGRAIIINTLNKLSFGFGVGDWLSNVDAWFFTSIAEFLTQSELDPNSFNSGNFLLKIIWIMIKQLLFD
jgi:hypothetical protein